MLRENVAFDDRYAIERGRIILSGIQALVRLPQLQAHRDRAAGLDTAGFISGYRGSPLGGLDQALWQAQSFLDEARVVFKPGVNEDLAATAVQGTQQVGLFPGAKHQGVFGMWYGKAPGLDRSFDAIRHATPMPRAPRPMAVCSPSSATITAASPPRCRVRASTASPTWGCRC